MSYNAKATFAGLSIVFAAVTLNGKSSAFTLCHEVAG
jgi:hypothetical protein